MSDWTAGYVTDVGYTYGYYSELNPLRCRLALLHAGLAAPPVTGTACELGFGQGITISAHAAASATAWYGTDFNPAQVAFAQEMSARGGNGAHLFDDAFADFARRADLPDFDFIGLHGIWSWISDANRAVIVDFIRRKLKVGGVAYVSYNTQPGWASFAPMQHLMKLHHDTLGRPGAGVIKGVDEAIGFAKSLLATNPLYAKVNPFVATSLEQLGKHNNSYLAHEYFNRNWHPLHFADTAAQLDAAKLDYGCSAHFLDHVPAINLTDEQQTVVNQFDDVVFRETVRDFMVNQRFRRDYWVKGVRKLNSLDRLEALRQERVVLVKPRADLAMKITASVGEVALNEKTYTPILDALADYQTLTLGELEEVTTPKGIAFAALLEAVIVLCGKGDVTSAQPEPAIQAAKPRCDALNADLMSKARSSADIGYLACPVVGGALAVGRFEKLFIQAAMQGQREPTEWAAFAWQLLAAQGQRIVKDGKAVDAPEENLAFLADQAQAFAEKQLPILKALQVA